MRNPATINDEIRAEREAQRRLQDEMREIHERAGDRALSGGEQQRWDRLQRGVAKHDARLAELRDELTEAVMPHANDPRHIEGERPTRTASRSPRPGPLGALRDEAMRSIERSHRDGLVPDVGAQRVAELVEHDRTGLAAQWAVAAGDPDYARAFGKLLNDPLTGHREFTDGELRAFQQVQQVRAALQVGGGDSAGGFLVPTHLDPAVRLSNDGTLSPLRGVARVVQLAAGNVWNGVTSAGVTASYDAELSEVSDDSPELAGPSIPVYTARAFVQASIEAVEDLVGVAETVGSLFTDARDRLEADAFAVGNGTNEPTGLVTALLANTNVHVEVDTQGAFVANDVYKLRRALPPRWRPRARWAADLSTFDVIETLETSNGSRQFDLSGGTLLRRPFHEVSDFPDFTQTAQQTNPLMVYGDFSEFVLVDRIGTTVEFIPHLFGTTNGFPIGARGWFMHWRHGSDVTIDNAFRLLLDGSD